MRLSAGKLRHLITILAPKDNLDSFGDDSVSYMKAEQVYGAIEPLTGAEIFYARQMRSDATNKITLRWRGDLTAAHRLQWNGKTYEPGPPMNKDERNIITTFLAKEIRNQPLPAV